MKVQLTIEIDDTDEGCEEVLEHLEFIFDHELEARIVSDSVSIPIAVLDVRELPAVGAPRKEATDG